MLAPPFVQPALVRHYDNEGGCHDHGHAQVLFGWDGTLEMEVHGRQTWVDGSCGLVIPAGTRHAYRAAARARLLVLDCEPGPGTQRLRRFALQPGWQRLAHDPARLLAQLTHAPTLAARRRIDLASLRQRVDTDLARPWTVADLAALCCLSPQRLRARFAQALGESPMDYVRGRRLQRAMQLLQDGLAMETVALHVGYASASALSAALRREHGTGARALRTQRALRAS